MDPMSIPRTRMRMESNFVNFVSMVGFLGDAIVTVSLKEFGKEVMFVKRYGPATIQVDHKRFVILHKK